MAFKTLQQIAVAGSVADADITGVASGSGAMHSATMAVLAAYFGPKLGGTSGHVFGFLDGANTLSGTQTLSIGTATSAADYLVLKPTDYAAGKPALFFSKEASALNWQVRLFDGTTVAGQIDLGLTLLNLTGALTVSGLGTFGSLSVTGALAVTGAATLGAGVTLTGSTKQNVQAMAALDVDLSASEFFTKSISANSTFTFSNATAAKGAAFLLFLTISSGATPTWPASVKWTDGSAPIPGNGSHLFGFATPDGGSTWVGNFCARNYG